MSFRALVGEVWPYRRGPDTFGADLVVHVVTGTVEVGDEVDVAIGPGATTRARVESVAESDPAAPFVKARIALPGQPPGPGARLDLRLPDLSPTDVVLLGAVETPGAGGAPRPAPPCPWAAVFDTLRRVEDGRALIALFEEDPALLANGEPPDYFLGCIASVPAITAVVGDRLRALFGDDDATTHETGADERDAFADRVRQAGVELTVAE